MPAQTKPFYLFFSAAGRVPWVAGRDAWRRLAGGRDVLETEDMVGVDRGHVSSSAYVSNRTVEANTRARLF